MFVLKLFSVLVKNDQMFRQTFINITIGKLQNPQNVRNRQINYLLLMFIISNFSIQFQARYAFDYEIVQGETNSGDYFG